MLKNIYFLLNVSYLQMSLKYFHSNQLYSNYFLLSYNLPQKTISLKVSHFCLSNLINCQAPNYPIICDSSLSLLASSSIFNWSCLPWADFLDLQLQHTERLHIESMQHISHQSDIVSTVGMRLNLENRILGSNSGSAL